jgi:hypothetical protein
MMVLGYDVSESGGRALTLRLDVGRRLWPAWRYDGPRALVQLIGRDHRASVRATEFTYRELAALRHAEEVLRCPSPLLLASLAELTPIRWRCGCPVDVAEVAREIRRGAVMS